MRNTVGHADSKRSACFISQCVPSLLAEKTYVHPSCPNQDQIITVTSIHSSTTSAAIGKNQRKTREKKEKKKEVQK